MARVRFLVPLFGALALVAGAASTAGAAPPDAASAVGFLDAQQVSGTDPTVGAGSWDADEGFGLSEFNTSEAVLAIASAAQTGPGWDPAAARLAVEASVNADGVSPLEFLDHWAEGSVSAGLAGKILLLVALPLDDGSAGFDPAAWDPAGDGTPVDLVAAVGGCADEADYGFFGQTTVAMQAVAVLCGQAGPAATQTVLAAQQPNGGWSFDGDPTGNTPAEVDTTSSAIMALVAGGVDGAHPAILDGLEFLAQHHEPQGWWEAFGSASPDSSSRAMLAITAAGWDLNSSAWRDHALPQAAASPYVSPDDALGALQQPDGSIVGPGTFSPVYATAQAVQAVERNWLPVATTVAPPPRDIVDPPPEPPRSETVEPDPVTPAPGQPDLVEHESVAPEPELVEAVDQTEPGVSGSLPRTGGGAELALIGVTLVLAGAPLALRRPIRDA